MNAIPTITRHDIRTFEQNFLKGQQHNRAGAIVNRVQLSRELKAYCYGSLPEPFRVQVTWNDTGIIAALCSCSADTPTDGGRGCEHTAALLLVWTEQPEVEWQFTMPPLPGQKSVHFDTDEYHRQVDEAFRYAGREWDAVYSIASDLSSITETASHFARQRDYVHAAAIYEKEQCDG